MLFRLLEVIVKLAHPIKSPFLPYFSPSLLAYLVKYDLIGTVQAMSLTLRTSAKTIDFLRYGGITSTIVSESCP